MDSQIGTDIAKLLGNLGKTTDSGGKPASNTEAGAAFKRALVASEQAHSTASGGKTLPAALRHQITSLPQGPVAATTPAPIFGTHGVVSTELPEFDLHVIGEPVGPRELRKFAEDTGLSAEALAQLFQQMSRSLQIA